MKFLGASFPHSRRENRAITIGLLTPSATHGPFEASVQLPAYESSGAAPMTLRNDANAWGSGLEVLGVAVAPVVAPLSLSGVTADHKMPQPTSLLKRRAARLLAFTWLW